MKLFYKLIFKTGKYIDGKIIFTLIITGISNNDPCGIQSLELSNLERRVIGEIRIIIRHTCPDKIWILVNFSEIH